MRRTKTMKVLLAVAWWCVAGAALLTVLEWIDDANRDDDGGGPPEPEIIPPDPGARTQKPRFEPEISPILEAQEP